jgi:RimJ/RimL family protein N-acetyltransferase
VTAPPLALRPLEPADCDLVASWVDSEDALYQWSGPADFTWPLEPGQLRRDLSRRRPGAALLAAVEIATGDVVGHVKLQVTARHRLGLIGRVMVAPNRQGRGRGTALMREVVRHGFDELGLHRLQLTVYAFNSPALAVYRNAGFTVEGRLPDAALGAEGFWTALIMGMLESDPRPSGPADATGWTVRDARAGDRRQVAPLLTQLGYPQDEAQAGERLAAWSTDPGSAVLVAERARVLGGLVAVTRVPYFERPGAFARIVALAVAEAHRQRGLGRALMGAAEAWAARNGCADMEVTSARSRDAAHRFYPALGYAEQGMRSARYQRPLGEPPPPARQNGGNE